MALMASARDWPCKLVLHGDYSRCASLKGNLLLMRLVGADIEVVRPEQISEKIEESVGYLERRGYSPAIIPGGGHTLEGALAYVDAAGELMRRCDPVGWIPDIVIVPSGTGTTQAGLISGLRCRGCLARVIGISVARSNPRGRDVVIQSYAEVGEHIGIGTLAADVDFRDDWTCGGYEFSNEKINSAISLAAKLGGLILDPTYTGKAFLALLDLVSGGEIGPGSRVVFWHTGGLMASDDHISMDIYLYSYY
jgi:1-aminocyclopropane-1-carboxylate deaminase/D-cysteine desulfhydrase-like pyridoxal-dependent ACC family enzyme